METLILVCVIALLLFSMILLILSRYKKCPSDKVMVIYGKVGSNKDGSARSAKCIHGGAAFVWPVIQAREFLDLTPLSISVDLENALSRQNIRINVPSRFPVGISTEPGTMQNAAERLLGLKAQEIQELAKDIIFGQLRLVIATMDIEEINTDRDKFLEAVSRNVEGELKKIGLRLINVNVTDISDESGYIAALGKEAAAKAINDAKKSVAEKDRDGSIGEANAHRDQRVQVAQADSEAIKGENAAKMEVAMSNAARREKEAEALKIADEQGLDLVKISPQAVPPVCKLMNYGKFRFEQSKREKEARKNQHVVEIKEIRMSPGIDIGDFNTKLKNAQKFIADGNRVKVSVRFRGREMAHTDIGRDLLDRFAAQCAETANLDKPAKLEGRMMSIFLSPKSGK